MVEVITSSALRGQGVCVTETFAAARQPACSCRPNSSASSIAISTRPHACIGTPSASAVWSLHSHDIQQRQSPISSKADTGARSKGSRQLPFQSTLLMLTLLSSLVGVEAQPPGAPSASPPPQYPYYAEFPVLRGVNDEQELMGALQDNTLLAVHLNDNIRLTPAAWAPVPIVRSANFTIVGDPYCPILDLSFLEAKVHLQPGVALVFKQVEIRNARQRSGFEIDFVNASPDAVVRYESGVYHCFSCLPIATLISVIEAMVPSGLPQNVSTGTWSRTQWPLEKSYNESNVIAFGSASAKLAVSGLQGVTSGGGYSVEAYNISLVCEQPVTDDCGLTQGWDYCVRNKVQELYLKDNTWQILDAISGKGRDFNFYPADPGQPPGIEVALAPPPLPPAPFEAIAVVNSDGGRVKHRGAKIAAVVVGVFSVAVLLTVAALYMLRHRDRDLRCAKIMTGKSLGAGSSTAAGGVGGRDSKASYNGANAETGSGAFDGAGSADSAGGGDGSGGTASVQVLIATAGVESDALRAHGGGGLTPSTEGPSSKASHAPTAAALPLSGAASSSGAPSSRSAPPPAAASPPLAAAPLALLPPPSPTAAVASAAAAGHAVPAASAAAAATLASASRSSMGESYVHLSSSEASGTAHMGGRGGGAAVMEFASVKSAIAGRDKPVVMVAGITIELSSTIGSGSFGKVFPGTWQGRSVAVKVLQYGSELCRAVHNEVLLSQTLRHPNVVSALYFAQVLPGGRLGLHTGGSGAGGGGPYNREGQGSDSSRNASPSPLGKQPVGLHGIPGDGRAGGSAAAAGIYSRFIFSGAAGEAAGDETGCGATSSLPPEILAAKAEGGAESGSGAAPQVVLPLSSSQGLLQAEGQGCPGAPHEVGDGRAAAAGAGAGAAAAEADVVAGGHGTVLPRPRARSQPNREAEKLDPKLEQQGRNVHAAGATKQQQESMGTASVPLSFLRGRDLDTLGQYEFPYGDFEHEDSEEQHEHGSSCSAVTRTRSEPDVLSRWDEQRRRQAQAERAGTQPLVIPAAQVTPNGFVVQTQGLEAAAAGAAAPSRRAPPEALASCETAVGGASGTTIAAAAAAAAAAAQLSSGSRNDVETEPAQQQSNRGAAAAAGPVAQSRKARGSHEGGGGTASPPAAAAAAAAAELPLEALWLAAHTQPAEGSSHGFLVMELCEGGSAFAWRSVHWKGADERPDLSVLLRLALDVAYGMSYIHSMGICHGDLKLSNVLLARSTDAAATGCNDPNDLLAGWVAKVCDFGLSRVLTGDRTHVSTRPYGTPTHMAPELWTKGHVSQQADVYAFGVTLWELATGLRPYKGLNAACILHRVLLTGGRPVLPLWLPPSYTRLVTSCWAQSPKDRPTFSEIVRHLEAMLAVLAAVTPR